MASDAAPPRPGPDGGGRALAAQSAILVAGNGAAAALSMAYAALLGRALGPAGYGEVATALSLSYLLSLLLGPLETGVSQLAAGCYAEGARGRLATLTFGALRRLLLPLAAALALWAALTPALGRALRLQGPGPLLALGAYAALSVLVSVLRGAQRGDHRFAAFALNQVAEAALRLGAGAALLHLGAGPGGAVAGYALGMGAALLLCLAQLADLGREARAPLPPVDLYRLSLPLLLIYLFFQLSANLDVLFAKRFLPAAEAGLYGAASTLARALFLVATPLYQLAFSRAAALRAEGRSVRGLLTLPVAVVSLGLLASALVPALFGGPLLALLFGAPFSAARPVLLLLWLAASLLALESLGTFVLIGLGRAAGAWAFLLPSALLPALLLCFHGSAEEIARCALGAALAGLPALGAMIYFSGRRRNAVRPKDTL